MAMVSFLSAPIPFTSLRIQIGVIHLHSTYMASGACELYLDCLTPFQAENLDKITFFEKLKVCLRYFYIELFGSVRISENLSGAGVDGQTDLAANHD